MLTPRRVHIKNHPIESPVSIFNPGLLYDEREDKFLVYPRLIIGYYMYVSAIAEMEIDRDDIETSQVNMVHYPATLVICPTCPGDIWGTEDPRAQWLWGAEALVYTGRNINYFNPLVRSWRTAPIIAVKKYKKFVKIAIFKTSGYNVVSDKDAFLFKLGDKLYFFHRPHVVFKGSEEFLMVISEINEEELRKAYDSCPLEDSEVCGSCTPKPIYTKHQRIVMKEERWEEKLGWGTPLVEVEKGRYVTLAHAVDKLDKSYKAFALLFEAKGEDIVLKALTPFYILAPMVSYEVYGDRPLVVFPTGLAKIDDKLIVAYGAADYVVGFGKIDISELMSLMVEFDA